MSFTRMTKPVSARLKVDFFLSKFQCYCPGCGEQLLPGQDIQWDHHHADALGGPHTYENLRPMHTECHRIKTSGTKATSYGSDIHAIRKIKRLTGKVKTRPKRKWPKRAFPVRGVGL